jgi:signal peptidase II
MTEANQAQTHMRWRGLGLFLLFSAIGAGLDLWSKQVAFAHVTPGRPIVVIDGCFHLTYAVNRGAAFSLFLGQLNFFYVVSGCAAVLLGYFAWTAPRSGTWRQSAALGLLGAGVLGNLHDRIRFGHVRDFLDVYVGHEATARTLESWFGTSHWPTFNLADSFICVGALFLLKRFWKDERGRATETTTTARTAE